MFDYSALATTEGLIALLTLTGIWDWLWLRVLAKRRRKGA